MKRLHLLRGVDPMQMQSSPVATIRTGVPLTQRFSEGGRGLPGVVNKFPGGCETLRVLQHGKLHQ